MENIAANDASFKPILDLQKTQLQQLSVLKNLEHLSKQDTVFQAAQLAEDKVSVEEEVDILEELKKINSNLLKFGQSVRAAVPAGKPMIDEEGDGYGEGAFSFRNLFDIKRGSGGLIDTYLSQKEDAKANRIKTANAKALASMHATLAEKGALGNLALPESPVKPEVSMDSTSVGGVTASERQEENDELARTAVEQSKEQTRLLGAILAALTGFKPKPTEPTQQQEGKGFGDVLSDVAMASMLKRVAGFVFSTAALKLLLAAGVAAALVNLAMDYRKGKAESEDYKGLIAKKKAGTITAEEQQKLNEYEAKKATGEGPYSGSKAEESGRAIKSHMDKDTAEQTLNALKSEDPKEREWGEQNLKEYGITHKALQLYYDKMYSPTASAETRKGITLATASVQSGELQALPAAATVTEQQPKSAALGETVRSELQTTQTTKGTGTKVAGKMVYPGQELSQKQLKVVEMGIASGIKYPQEIIDQYQKQTLSATSPSAISKTSTDMLGDRIYQESTQAEDAKENLTAAKSNGTQSIVSAPTTINSNKTQINNGKPDIRNSDSSFNRYMDSRY